MTLEADPIDWELDGDGDLIVPIRYVRGLAAVAQRIRVRLRLWRGEWFLNRGVGVPYLPRPDGSVTEREALLGGRFDEVRTRAEITSAILGVPDVVELLALQMAFNGQTRILLVQFRARTRFGDTQPTSVGLVL